MILQAASWEGFGCFVSQVFCHHFSTRKTSSKNIPQKSFGATQQYPPHRHYWKLAFLAWLLCKQRTFDLSWFFFDIGNEILPVLLPIDCWGLFTSHEIKDPIMKQPVMECSLSILVKWIDSQQNIVSICQEAPWYFIVHVCYSFVLFPFQMT